MQDDPSLVCDRGEGLHNLRNVVFYVGEINGSYWLLQEPGKEPLSFCRFRSSVTKGSKPVSH